jgi:O-antigen/teichoic acid export membrane protein
MNLPTVSRQRDPGFEGRFSADRSARRLQLAAQAAISGIGSHAVSVGTNLLLVPVMLHFMGAQYYGLWLTLQSLTALTAFFDFGLSNSALNAITAANAKKDYAQVGSLVMTTFVVLAGIAAAAGLSAVAAWPLIPWGRICGDSLSGSTSDISTGAAVFAAYAAALLPLAFVERVAVAFQDGRLANVARAIASVATLASAVVVVKCGGSFTSMCLATTLPSLVVWAGTWTLLGKSRPWIFPVTLRLDLSSLRQITAAGMMFVGIQATAVLGSAIDNPIIAAIAGPAAVAVYAAHYKLFALVSVLSALFLSPLWPAYADAEAHQDRQWVQTTLTWSVRTAAVCAAIFGAGLLAVFPYVMRIWLSDEIAPNWILAGGMCAQAVLASIGTAYAMFWNGTHQLRLQLILGIIYVAVSLPLRAWILHSMGVEYYSCVIAASYLACVVAPAYLIGGQLASRSSRSQGVS